MSTILIAGLLLALKHFLCDGPFQTPFQYLNKGKLLHPGGLLHAGIHAIGTFMALIVAGVDPGLVGALAIFDGVMHYTIDFAKTNLTKKEWAERTGVITDLGGRQIHPAGLLIKSDWYFYALVLDQSLHFACYAAILAAVAG